MSNNQLRDEILAREERLLHGDMRTEPGLADELLASGFEEVATDGTVTKREQVVEWLRNKSPEDRWEFLDFKVSELGRDMVLCRYRTRRRGSTDAPGSRRTSLWRRVGGGPWQMHFHQATPIRPPEESGA